MPFNGLRDPSVKMLIRCSMALVFASMLCRCEDSSAPVYPLDAAPNYYHLSGTINGQPVTMNYGRYELPDQPTVTLSPEATTIRIDAQSARDFFEEQAVVVSLGGWLHASSTDYLGTYDCVITGPPGFADMYLAVWERGVAFSYRRSGGSLTITSFGDEGEDVEGTLSLNFQPAESPAGPFSPAFGPAPVISGEFRLRRAPSSYFVPLPSP